jgi:hypothetical protein
MADYTKIAEKDIEKKIQGFRLAMSKFEGKNEKIVSKAKAEIEKLEKELEGRSGKAEEEKKSKEEAKKAVEKTEAKKKPTAKKEDKKEDKKPTEKKKPKPKPRVYPSPASKFELTIDGKTYKFDDLKSKEQCEKAIKAVKARRDEQVKHKKAREEGAEQARTIPVTRKITDGFVSVTKKAVTEAKKHDRSPAEFKREIAAVEKAFSQLFDKLETLMGKKIPATQRKSVMDILGSFEDTVEKGASKKEKAKTAKKEDGGIIDDSSTWDNDWSYASLMD